MANEIALGLVIVVLVGVSLAVVIQVISFIVDVPNQLKRIADALEKEKEDGK